MAYIVMAYTCGTHSLETVDDDDGANNYPATSTCRRCRRVSISAACEEAGVVDDGLAPCVAEDEDVVRADAEDDEQRQRAQEAYLKSSMTP